MKAPGSCHTSDIAWEFRLALIYPRRSEDRAGGERQSEDGDWHPSPGDIQSRFPVRIFSQKQILALASDRAALLQLIDGSPIADGAGIAARRSEIESTFLRLRSQIRELESRIASDDQILGGLTR